MKVVPLHPNHDCANIATALRNIADDVEGGKYDFDPTMAVVVLGMEKQRHDADGYTLNYAWQSHGLGDKTTYFAAKGLLAAALHDFDGGN